MLQAYKLYNILLKFLLTIINTDTQKNEQICDTKLQKS